MNWVLENFVQGASNGLEGILLKFQVQVSYANFYRIKELFKIWEDGLPVNSIIKTLYFEKKFHGDSIKKILEFQEDLYYDSSEDFLSCCDNTLPSPLSPTKVVHVTIKGEDIQRNKQLHKISLDLQGKIHPLPYISMDKFSMFFGNTSEDAKKHLVKFDSACDIHNVAENDVACRLFILTLTENASECFYSLMLRSITSWDVLENLFVDKYFPRNDPYFLFLKLV
jgi:hypothetical protein